MCHNFTYKPDQILELDRTKQFLIQFEHELVCLKQKEIRSLEDKSFKKL